MLTIRNQQVLLDRDVAALYGVETKALNQAVKRNAEKFPVGYILKLTDEECSRSQIVTLNGGRGSNLKYLPYAFTERGLYMLATVLKSARATQATLALAKIKDTETLGLRCERIHGIILTSFAPMGKRSQWRDYGNQTR